MPKPTPAALRAAEAIAVRIDLRGLIASATPSQECSEVAIRVCTADMALVIDRETSLPELVRAAKQQYLHVMSENDPTGSNERLRRAISRCIGTLDTP